MPRPSKHSEAVIIQALQSLQHGKTQTQLAKELGVTPLTIGNYKKKYASKLKASASTKKKAQEDNDPEEQANELAAAVEPVAPVHVIPSRTLLSAIERMESQNDTYKKALSDILDILEGLRLR